MLKKIDYNYYGFVKPLVLGFSFVAMKTFQYLLLGGTGFIGSELAKALYKKGEGNILCVGKSHEAFTEEEIVSIAEDLAFENTEWEKHPSKNVFILIGQNHQEFDLDQELALLRGIVEKINDWKVSTRVFYFSSVLVYGESEEGATEATEPQPGDPYSQFKYRAEQMLESELDPKHALVILRLSNVYGSPRNKGFIGLLMRSFQEGSVLTVNGGGLQMRDYIYIDDVIRAIVNIVHQPPKAPRERVNIATGVATSLNNVIATFSEVVGSLISYQVREAAPAEVRVSKPDIQKLRVVYGYVPVINLKEGLAKTWQKYQMNTNN